MGTVNIIGVAIKCGAIIFAIPKPGRHYMLVQALDEAQYPHVSHPDQQGFLTSTGCFATRDQALKIVSTNGQLLKPLIGATLTSEDLW